MMIHETGRTRGKFGSFLCPVGGQSRTCLTRTRMPLRLDIQVVAWESIRVMRGRATGKADVFAMLVLATSGCSFLSTPGSSGELIRPSEGHPREEQRKQKTSSAPAIPRVYVKFSVISSSPAAQAAASRSALEEEVAILNTYFRTDHHEPLIGFQFASMATHGELSDTPCKELLEMGDSIVDTDAFARQFNACADTAIRDPHAINFYVADAWARDERGAVDRSYADSYGRYNRGHPFIILDYTRLGHRTQSPEEHEMGHAFNLDHVCVVGATPSTSTNIMASAGRFTDPSGAICGTKGGSCDCPFSGGRRNLGFDAEQIATIKKAAVAIADALR